MKKKRIGIFAKMFFYTIILILTIIVTASIVFHKQIVEFYDVSRHQQVRETFIVFQEQLDGKSYEDVKKIAEQFHIENPSFEFALHDHRGTLLYTTPQCEGILDPDTEGWKINDNPNLNMNLMNFNPADKDLGLLAFYPEFGPAYFDFFTMSALVLVVVLILSSMGAAIFAKLITNPVRKLAEDVRRMSMLEPVLPPVPQYDEIGQLKEDVHKMYEKLKTTIASLEQEIQRRIWMEESQRYFFSAASHELKTPIAATGALLEGMLENVGDYQNHPKYIVECLKLMDIQSKLVNDILEIVKLDSHDIEPLYEKVNLNETIAELLPPYETLVEQKSQRLEIDIQPGLFCMTDKNMFIRVFCNVLINGIQNSTEGTGIKVWCEDNEKNVKLNLLNTGVSIEETTMEKLFEPFYRLDSARSRKDGHSGIGLAIVKKLLESMEIPFDICNTAEGVVFWMVLPKR